MRNNSRRARNHRARERRGMLTGGDQWAGRAGLWVGVSAGLYTLRLRRVTWAPAPLVGASSCMCAWGYVRVDCGWQRTERPVKVVGGRRGAQVFWWCCWDERGCDKFGCSECSERATCGRVRHSAK